MPSLVPESLPSPSLDLLLAWFSTRQIHIDARLDIRETDGSGWTVFASDGIDVEEMICRIPKSSMFTHRTSSLARAKLPLDPMLPPTFVLALHLLHEFLIGASSPWWGYIQSLPRERLPLAMFWEDWEGEQGRKAWGIAHSGDVGWRVRRNEKGLGASVEDAQWGAGGLPALKLFFASTVLPIIAKSPLLRHLTPFPPPSSLSTFLHAYSLVSSRAFHVDDYHHVGLVPLADLFNHASPNNVQFTVDQFVCETCGSLLTCEHDGPRTAFLPGRLSHLQDLEEQELLALFSEEDSADIVAHAQIEAGQELFNSYGDLSSSQLLCEYGFIPEDAMSLPFDRVHFDVPSFPQLLLPLPPSLSDLVEGPRFAATLPPSDRFYVSADGQLSHQLFQHVLQVASSRTHLEPTSLGSSGSSDLQTAVAMVVSELLLERLQGLRDPEELWDLQEVETSSLVKTAATMVLGERATLEACLARWAGDGDDESE